MVLVKLCPRVINVEKRFEGEVRSSVVSGVNVRDGGIGQRWSILAKG